MTKPSKQRIWIRVFIALGAAALLFTAVTFQRAHRQFDAPLPDLHASADPSVIERGQYLVRGPAHCGECHGAVLGEGERRLDRPLTGGFVFELPVGTFRVPNITPDPETGIGRYTDPQLARMLRYGVKPDGTLAVPFMPYANLCDDDIVAILSYLRSQPPVSHAVPEHDVNALGTVAMAYFIAPKGPSRTPSKALPPQATAEYGGYLANDVGNCAMCHTKLDESTGAFAGPLFGGGARHPSEGNPELVFVSPNLTPNSRWGWLEGWSEDAFVNRLHGGRVHPESPMPWEAVQRMSDTDLRAIFRYLKTLPPASGGPDPKIREVRVAGQ